MAQKKQFKDLDLSNAFLFAAALEDEETCRLVLECILGTPVGKVKVKAERNILFSSDFRCVRLDVFASGEWNVDYNLEMQNTDEKNLPQRSRYHQAEMDLSSLKPGQDFKELKPSVIVFICSFDPFGRGLYRYTFEPRCLEADFPLEDGTRRIFLNTKGTNDSDVPKELVSFLQYVTDSTDSYVEQAGNIRLERIHERIKALKQSKILEEGYMQLGELLKQEHDEGLRQGYKTGYEKGYAEASKMLELVSRLIADGKTDCLPRLKEDKDFYQEMLKKYHL
ncbi:MAG: Rpn family recombination-promoting nuclease/putative transposase [Lachnospiraceae bacterium]|nr:Rpn family recombination-promoting nuclease/putative transposase [Lachnospiraceae bacterium]